MDFTKLRRAFTHVLLLLFLETILRVCFLLTEFIWTVFQLEVTRSVSGHSLRESIETFWMSLVNLVMSDGFLCGLLLLPAGSSGTEVVQCNGYIKSCQKDEYLVILLLLLLLLYVGCS